MSTNIGTIDRSLRAVLGFALLWLLVSGPKTLWGLIGAVLLFTALVGFCPLYRVLGINTLGRHGAHR